MEKAQNGTRSNGGGDLGAYRDRGNNFVPTVSTFSSRPQDPAIAMNGNSMHDGIIYEQNHHAPHGNTFNPSTTATSLRGNHYGHEQHDVNYYNYNHNYTGHPNSNLHTQFSSGRALPSDTFSYGNNPSYAPAPSTALNANSNSSSARMNNEAYTHPTFQQPHTHIPTAHNNSHQAYNIGIYATSTTGGRQILPQPPYRHNLNRQEKEPEAMGTGDATYRIHTSNNSFNYPATSTSEGDKSRRNNKERKVSASNSKEVSQAPPPPPLVSASAQLSAVKSKRNLSPLMKPPILSVRSLSLSDTPSNVYPCPSPTPIFTGAEKNTQNDEKTHVHIHSATEGKENPSDKRPNSTNTADPSNSFPFSLDKCNSSESGEVSLESAKTPTTANTTTYATGTGATISDTLGDLGNTGINHLTGTGSVAVVPLVPLDPLGMTSITTTDGERRIGFNTIDPTYSIFPLMPPQTIIGSAASASHDSDRDGDANMDLRTSGSTVSEAGVGVGAPVLPPGAVPMPGAAGAGYVHPHAPHPHHPMAAYPPHPYAHPHHPHPYGHHPHAPHPGLPVPVPVGAPVPGAIPGVVPPPVAGMAHPPVPAYPPYGYYNYPYPYGGPPHPHAAAATAAHAPSPSPVTAIGIGSPSPSATPAPEPVVAKENEIASDDDKKTELDESGNTPVKKKNTATATAIDVDMNVNVNALVEVSEDDVKAMSATSPSPVMAPSPVLVARGPSIYPHPHSWPYPYGHPHMPHPAHPHAAHPHAAAHAAAAAAAAGHHPHPYGHYYPPHPYYPHPPPTVPHAAAVASPEKVVEEVAEPVAASVEKVNEDEEKNETMEQEAVAEPTTKRRKDSNDPSAASANANAATDASDTSYVSMDCKSTSSSTKFNLKLNSSNKDAKAKPVKFTFDNLPASLLGAHTSSDSRTIMDKKSNAAMDVDDSNGNVNVNVKDAMSTLVPVPETSPILPPENSISPASASSVPSGSVASAFRPRSNSNTSNNASNSKHVNDTESAVSSKMETGTPSASASASVASSETDATSTTRKRSSRTRTRTRTITAKASAAQAQSQRARSILRLRGRSMEDMEITTAASNVSAKSTTSTKSISKGKNSRKLSLSASASTDTDLSLLQIAHSASFTSTRKPAHLLRKDRKNTLSRGRAAKLKIEIEMITRKPASERNPDERAKFAVYEEKRLLKNKISRDRATEKKKKFDAIRRKNSKDWTEDEKFFMKDTQSAKKRKNHGDRARRRRIKRTNSNISASDHGHGLYLSRSHTMDDDSVSGYETGGYASSMFGSFDDGGGGYASSRYGSFDDGGGGQSGIRANGSMPSRYGSFEGSVGPNPPSSRSIHRSNSQSTSDSFYRRDDPPPVPQTHIPPRNRSRSGSNSTPSSSAIHRTRSSTSNCDATMEDSSGVTMTMGHSTGTYRPVLGDYYSNNHNNSTGSTTAMGNGSERLSHSQHSNSQHNSSFLDSSHHDVGVSPIPVPASTSASAPFPNLRQHQQRSDSSHGHRRDHGRERGHEQQTSLNHTGNSEVDCITRHVQEHGDLLDLTKPNSNNPNITLLSHDECPITPRDPMSALEPLPKGLQGFNVNDSSSSHYNNSHHHIGNDNVYGGHSNGHNPGHGRRTQSPILELCAGASILDASLNEIAFSPTNFRNVNHNQTINNSQHSHQNVHNNPDFLSTPVGDASDLAQITSPMSFRQLHLPRRNELRSDDPQSIYNAVPNDLSRVGEETGPHHNSHGHHHRSSRDTNMRQHNYSSSTTKHGQSRGRRNNMNANDHVGQGNNDQHQEAIAVSFSVDTI